METEEKVVFMVSVNGHEVAATIGNHTSCKCVEEPNTFDGEPDTDKGFCKDEFLTYLNVALCCGVFSMLISLLNGLVSIRLFRRYSTGK